MSDSLSGTPLAARIHDLPLVLAGPVVRRVEPDAVTVWLALRRPAEVRLRVISLEQGDALMHGSRPTVPLGDHLHVVAVTAASTSEAALERGGIFGYDIGFDLADGVCLDSLLAPGVVAHDQACARAALLYDGGPAWPSFAVPPARIEDLRIIHGSCRRPGRGGIDAMPDIDTLIAHRPSAREHRPHMLMLTGDNIYSDGLGPRALLEIIADCAHTLLGWREYLPGYECYADEVPLHQRDDVPTRHMGHPEPAPVQLFGLGEFLAVHLLLLSDALWPADIPESEETAALTDLRRGLGRVRRALANISTYAMFDDHEVSDDWNLNRRWCELVYQKPLGRRVVQNALVSFALVHAWGNQPRAFADTGDAPGPGARLLELVRAWRPTRADADARELQRILGIPESGAALLAHGEPPRLWHETEALDWHFQIHAPDYLILALDLRSWRAFPGPTPLSLPDLLSSEALDGQLPPRLFEDAGARAATIVVSSIPVLRHAETRLERVRLYLRTWFYGLYCWLRGRSTIRETLSFGGDDGDIWSPATRSFSELFTRLAPCRRVVFLSGDVHIAFAARATLASGDGRAVFAQLTSSGMLNEKPSMRGWQKYGYNQPWPWRQQPKPVQYALGDGSTSCVVRHLRADGERTTGCEVVSNNNIGEVVFAWRERELVVEQRTWWRDGDAEMQPHTRFIIDLE